MIVLKFEIISKQNHFLSMLSVSRSMGNKSDFDLDDKKFIIDQFLSGKKATAVKRAYITLHGNSRKLQAITLSSFQNVFETYKKKAERATGLRESEPRGHRIRDEAAIQRVKALFEESDGPSPSTREAGRLLHLPHNTVWRYLSTYLSLKFYRVSLHSTFQIKVFTL